MKPFPQWLLHCFQNIKKLAWHEWSGCNGLCLVFVPDMYHCIRFIRLDFLGIDSIIFGTGQCTHFWDSIGEAGLTVQYFMILSTKNWGPKMFFKNCQCSKKMEKCGEGWQELWVVHAAWWGGRGRSRDGGSLWSEKCCKLMRSQVCPYQAHISSRPLLKKKEIAILNLKKLIILNYQFS